MRALTEAGAGLLGCIVAAVGVAFLAWALCALVSVLKGVR